MFWARFWSIGLALVLITEAYGDARLVHRNVLAQGDKGAKPDLGTNNENEADIGDDPTRSPLDFRVNVKPFNDGSKYPTLVLRIQSTNDDEITVLDVRLDGGRPCFLHTPIRSKMPARLKFGEELFFPLVCSDVLEVSITTDRGEVSYSLH